MIVPLSSFQKIYGQQHRIKSFHLKIPPHPTLTPTLHREGGGSERGCEGDYFADISSVFPYQGLSKQQDTVFCRQILTQQWDKGHRQRPARDQRKEQIGQVVGRIKRVQFSGQSELAPYEDRATKSQDFIQQEKETEQERGAGKVRKFIHGAASRRR